MADPAGTGRRLSARAACGVLGGILAAAGIAFAMGNRPAATAAPVLAPVRIPAVNGANGSAVPEALLVKTLSEIQHKRLDAALSEIEKVIQAYPNFRLAHLIKGDLLLARARPLTEFGSVRGAPRDQLEDLREEAKARLARYHQTRPTGHAVPKYLLQLRPAQRHAFIVDTSGATLYVFENRDGKPRYIADYYIAIGKNGVDKFREGDKKTPLGVYHVTGNLPRERLNTLYGKLGELYGAGALPINYPNEWDRRQGRTGYGIWLHGTPFDTYSRAPRSSDGCVALTNEDLEQITKTVQVGMTPVIITERIEWVQPEAVERYTRELNKVLESWRADWASLNTEKYLSHYAQNFSSGKKTRSDWVEHKRKVNGTKSWIKVGVSNVSMYLHPGQEEIVVVTFDQDYQSSNLSQRSRKRQYWVPEASTWKVIHEGTL
jgi:murein L,D-transpeptidase YafK